MAPQNKSTAKTPLPAAAWSAQDLEVSAACLVGHIQPRYDSLDTNMNHQVDIRWGTIVNGSFRTTANS
jgi:hypothetical protein